MYVHSVIVLLNFYVSSINSCGNIFVLTWSITVINTLQILTDSSVWRELCTDKVNILKFCQAIRMIFVCNCRVSYANSRV